MYKKIVVILTCLLMGSVEAPRSRGSSASSSRSRGSALSAHGASFGTGTTTGTSTDFSPYSPVSARRGPLPSRRSKAEPAPVHSKKSSKKSSRKGGEKGRSKRLEHAEVDAVSRLFNDAGLDSDIDDLVVHRPMSPESQARSDRAEMARLRASMNSGHAAKMLESRPESRHEAIARQRAEMNKHKGRRARGDMVEVVPHSPHSAPVVLQDFEEEA